jgi:hypothetical protein
MLKGVHTGKLNDEALLHAQEQSEKSLYRNNTVFSRVSMPFHVI